MQCDLCEYKTKNKTHLKRHSNIHQEWTTFEIEVDENDLLIGLSKEALVEREPS